MESDESVQSTSSSSETSLSNESQNEEQNETEKHEPAAIAVTEAAVPAPKNNPSDSNDKSSSGSATDDDDDDDDDEGDDDDDDDDEHNGVGVAEAETNESVNNVANNIVKVKDVVVNAANNNTAGNDESRQSGKVYTSSSASESGSGVSGSESSSESGSCSGSASESEDDAPENTGKAAAPAAVAPAAAKKENDMTPASPLVEGNVEENSKESVKPLLTNNCHDDELSDVSDMEIDKRELIENCDNKDDNTVLDAPNFSSQAQESAASNADACKNKLNLVLSNELKHVDEEALDFEAEEGECDELSSKGDEEDGKKSPTDSVSKTAKENGSEKDEGELEEGEISDEEERRQEEAEPKPICRFYTRGQCTWGMNCRFSHPGVTDKGNYTMFDSVRAVPFSQNRLSGNSHAMHPADYRDFHRNERPPLRPPIHASSHPYVPPPHSSHLPPHEPVPFVDNAWERGVRTAKERLRQASKRKEQDIDFEDKKMNLTSIEDFDKDPYYVKDKAGSPPISYPEYRAPPERYVRPSFPLPYEETDAYGRMARYRELPPDRMPQYEDEHRLRPAREVIVQRMETAGRGDDWNDPWMRSKSPGVRGSIERDDRRRRDRRSYSSRSSYSSSNSSKSYSSSGSSYTSKRKRHNLHSSANSRSRQRYRSESPTSQRIHRSTSRINTHLPMHHAIVDKRSIHSPIVKRRNTPSPPPKREQLKRRRDSSSDSDSSGSSYSNSGSNSSSSNSSPSSRKRLTAKTSRKAHDIQKQRAHSGPQKRVPISIELKKPSTVGPSALKSPSRPRSPLSDRESNSKNSDRGSNMRRSRREELLKQLRAVESAIAKKRSKLN